MAPCDPYVDPVVVPSVHEPLVSMLHTKDATLCTEPTIVTAKTILDLPNELLKHVLLYVVGKHDLAQVCKVNKRFFATALPQLYHTIHVDIKATIDPLLTQMFTVENTGLCFVRKVIVYADKTHGSNPQPAHQWLEILINQIPKDSLSHFRWDTPHPLPARVVKLLWQRQRNLEYVEVMPHYVQDSWNAEQYPPGIDLLEVMSEVEVPDARTLRAVVDTAASALLTGALLVGGDVSELEVDGRAWQNGDAHYADADDDEGDERREVHDSLTERIFHHLSKATPGHIASNRFLTSLALKDINLTLCKHTWCAYLDLSPLKQLRLEYCVGADIFLMRLAAGANTPGLHCFKLVHDLGTNADRTVHALEDLLSSPRNKMRKLELCLRNATALPSAASIRAHSKSLRRLLIDVTTKEQDTFQQNNWNQPSQSVKDKVKHLVYNTGNFVSIVQSCSSLRELGIAMPQTGLEYQHFFSDCGEFAEWIHDIVRHLRLATLNTLNWPENYKYGKSDGYYVAKNLQLARLASDIFRRHRIFDRKTGHFVQAERYTAFEVVAFGTRERGTTYPAPVYFMQSEVKILGKQHMHAESVSLKDLQNQDLDIEVLEHEERDFDEMSRKSFGASLNWATVSNDGNGWGE